MFLERLATILLIFPVNTLKGINYAKKLRLSERGTSEFSNFGLMSAGKSKILRKKWKKYPDIPGCNKLTGQQ